MVNSKARKTNRDRTMAISKNSNYDDQKRFSKDNVTLSKDFPIKLCCFNAYQMRDLIIRKLIEDPATRD